MSNFRLDISANRKLRLDIDDKTPQSLIKSRMSYRNSNQQESKYEYSHINSQDHFVQKNNIVNQNKQSEYRLDSQCITSKSFSSAPINNNIELINTKNYSSSIKQTYQENRQIMESLSKMILFEYIFQFILLILVSIFNIFVLLGFFNLIFGYDFSTSQYIQLNLCLILLMGIQAFDFHGKFEQIKNIQIFIKYLQINIFKFLVEGSKIDIIDQLSEIYQDMRKLEFRPFKNIFKAITVYYLLQYVYACYLKEFSDAYPKLHQCYAYFISIVFFINNVNQNNFFLKFQIDANKFKDSYINIIILQFEKLVLISNIIQSVATAIYSMLLMVILQYINFAYLSENYDEYIVEYVFPLEEQIYQYFFQIHFSYLILFGLLFFRYGFRLVIITIFSIQIYEFHFELLKNLRFKSIQQFEDFSFNHPNYMINYICKQSDHQEFESFKFLFYNLNEPSRTFLYKNAHLQNFERGFDQRNVNVILSSFYENFKMFETLLIQSNHQLQQVQNFQNMNSQWQTQLFYQLQARKSVQMVHMKLNQLGNNIFVLMKIFINAKFSKMFQCLNNEPFFSKLVELIYSIYIKLQKQEMDLQQLENIFLIPNISYTSESYKYVLQISSSFLSNLKSNLHAEIKNSQINQITKQKILDFN